MKMTDGDDPSRREEENNSNGSISGRNSPNGQILINGHHLLTNSDNSDNEAADENNAEHSHGYVLLPQNDHSRPPNPEPEIRDSNEEEEDDDEDETLEDILQRVREHQQTQPPTPHIQSMIEESQRQVEIETIQERISIFTSQPTTSSSQQQSGSRSAIIDMSQDRVETIRSAMSSIQLPASAIPPWATNLSDEEIQNVLRDKLSDVMSVHKKS